MPQLAALAVPLAVGGTALQAAGGIQSMNTADSTAKYNADALQRQAQAARVAGSYNASRIIDRAQATEGTQKAIQAANGVDPGSGSPVDVRAKSYDDAFQDALATLYGARQSATAANQQAKVIQAMRPANKLGAMLGIGGTLLQGGTNAALISRGYGTLLQGGTNAARLSRGGGG